MLETLKKRSTEMELMDDFQGSKEELKIVLEDISRVNRLLGGNRITINAVAELIRNNPQDSYVIMDLGCGDGTMLRELAKYCIENRIKVNLIGIDLNTDALEIATESSFEYPEIQFLKQDVLQLTPTDFNCDILISTLTTHHFTNEELPKFLKQFALLAKLGFVNNDLHRSHLALFLYRLFSKVFIRTRTAKIDGAISIKRGFKKNDLQALAKQLPQMKHFIKWKWAFRYVWIMEPKRQSIL